jgi:hypothetical protein
MRIGKFVAASARAAISDAAHDGPAKLQHSFDHLIGGLAHHQLFAVEQSYDGVRRLLDVLNKVGVERKAGVVQAGKLDHRRPRVGENDSGRTSAKVAECLNVYGSSDAP